MPAKKAAPVKKLKVTQVRSGISCPADQKATIKALGLKRIRHSVEHADNPTIRGMIFKVKHLVNVEEID
ncbi:MAG: 50S ribosomal protein L30 [Coriobacteriia bacterium]|nr:50S ribosomal protein L30 [Coriobacteriia bacterium]